MEDEAVRYGNPRYREWWAEPDGIWRDRDRYRRAREVILANPWRYARVMLGRMWAMVHYASGEAPTVALEALPSRVAVGGDGEPDARRPDRHPSDARFLAPGRAAAPLRPLVAVAQAVLLPVLLPLVAVGVAVLVRRDARRAALLLAIPVYYLLTESFFIFEWRVVTPMHYGLFVAAAAGALAAWDQAADWRERLRS
jgi:hypothetical protein